MKTEIKKICDTCQYYNMFKCIGPKGGEFMDEDETCDEWKISFNTYQDLEED